MFNENDRMAMIEDMIEETVLEVLLEMAVEALDEDELNTVMLEAVQELFAERAAR